MYSSVSWFIKLGLGNLDYKDITCPSVFSVKRVHVLYQPWLLESVVTGFRPSWRMCDLLSPQMSPGNTQWGLTVYPVTDITVDFTYLLRSISLPYSFFPFFPLSSSTGVFNLLPGKTSLWNYPFWSPGWSACVFRNLPLLNQWCYCWAMSAPCLSFRLLSCDCWVISLSVVPL